MNNDKTNPKTFRCEPGFMEMVDECCQREGVSFSVFVRDALIVRVAESHKRRALAEAKTLLDIA